MILWLEVRWEARVAQLWLSIAVERSESDSPAPGLKTIGANGDHAYVVEMTRFQAGDSDGCLLVCRRLTHFDLRRMLDVVCKRLNTHVSFPQQEVMRYAYQLPR